LALVFGGDMWRVSKRYMAEDDFVSEREFTALFNPTPADQAILQDPDPHYRVLNATKNPWTDGGTCYLHENVGGHHAAKLQRYQDLIETQLSSQLQQLNGGLMQTEQSILLSPQAAKQMPVYNMLNTKYFIVQANNPAGAVRNPQACGNAWFVNQIQTAANADEEVASLATFNPLETAVLSAEVASEMGNLSIGKGQDASVTLTSFTPNHLKYTSNNDSEGLAVFSEIFYADGWEAYIDGAPATIYRVNYVLRGLNIPAGQHEIEMRFSPSSYSLGNNMSLAGSALFLLFAGGLFYLHHKKRLD
jgi:uncharacterized membrane protein YfhO